MAYEKTWQFDINRAYSPSSITDMARWLLWYYKSFLTTQIGHATSPTVLLSATPAASGGSLTTGTYYYRIAINRGGVETAASNEFTVQVTGPNGKVTLTWASVAAVTNYIVYRGTSSGGEDVYYTTGSTSYVDTGAASTPGSPRTDLGAWWVVGSSDSSSADNFSSTSFGHDYLVQTDPFTYPPTKFVRNTAGSAHSWVVLRAPLTVGLTKAYYLLIDWSTATDYTVTITLGVDSAPTGGSNTTAPTMPNSIGSVLTTTNFSMSTNIGAFHSHGALSTDGSFNILMSRDGVGKFISGFIGALPANLKAIDTYPLWIHLTGEPTGATGYAVSTNSPENASFGIARYPDGTGGGNWATIIPVTTYVPNAADSFDGSFIDWPIWLGAAAVAYRCVRGRIQDMMYFGGGAATGSVDNPAGTPGFMVIGNYWFPTNLAPIL